MSEDLVLVDIRDREVGSADKATAHAVPHLHRAFSIFAIDDAGDVPLVLLQKRASSKYHSGGLWANTCCSHPRVGEPLLEAATRRLQEEMGIRCACREIGSFIYYYRFAPNLFEYEYDHVLTCYYRGPCKPNPAEVEDTAWVPIDKLAKGLVERPAQYAPWLAMAASLVIQKIGKRD
ncbi:MAG: isopentenyl-diphosphate Delta-isomerase [Coriobacteriales bacterium]|jgi:isopentenyl-diphosphate delta-isomerase|nr:isopentenyl-diphosphate Delta-isomerase [Coriobacteriales bacterium]